MRPLHQQFEQLEMTVWSLRAAAAARLYSCALRMGSPSVERLKHNLDLLLALLVRLEHNLDMLLLPPLVQGLHAAACVYAPLAQPRLLVAGGMAHACVACIVSVGGVTPPVFPRRLALHTATTQHASAQRENCFCLCPRQRGSWSATTAPLPLHASPGVRLLDLEHSLDVCSALESECDALEDRLHVSPSLCRADL